MKTQEQAYRDAFNGMSGEEIDAAKTDKTTGVDDTSTATDAAAEGATETPAVAVVITGEEGDETAQVDPEADAQVAAEDPAEAQRMKSWEGRMKAREAELKAREAALAEREAAMAGDVVTAKDGCKVEKKADGGKIEGEEGAGTQGHIDHINARYQTALENKKAGKPYDQKDIDAMGEMFDLDEEGEIKKYADGGEVGSEELQPEESSAPATKSDEDIIAEGNEIYGADFEGYVAALIRKNFAAEADPVVGKLLERIDAVGSSVQQGLESMQMDVLDALIDDLEDIVESDELNAWVESLPEEEKAKAKQVLQSGTIGQVKRLVQQFSSARGGDAGPTAQDIWAEDAATAVKGSGAVRLPSRPSASPMDEYSAAFNAS